MNAKEECNVKYLNVSLSTILNLYYFSGLYKLKFLGFNFVNNKANNLNTQSFVNYVNGIYGWDKSLCN